MQQILGIVIILSTLIASMFLAGSITMFIDTQALMISSGIFWVGIILNTTKETSFVTHLCRVFTNKDLTASEVEKSAYFYSNMNKFTIAASVITLMIAVVAIFHQFDQPKLLGPILAVTLLVTIYTGIASMCLFIPAKFKLLSLLPENNITDDSQSSAFVKAALGTLLINIILVLPWFLGGSFKYLMDLPSIIIIFMVVLGALIFVKNIKTYVLSQYLFSTLMTAGLVLYLVGIVAILSYDVDSFNQLLSAFSVSLLTVVFAIMVVLPFSLLINYLLRDYMSGDNLLGNKQDTNMNVKLLADNKSFVKSFTLITAFTSALTLFVIVVHFPK
jgi:flagellar motor component MotA